ncbi:hypothetical protein ACFQDZ_13915 [Sulfitobacter pacificus]|uniref:hypothetical protein n=1 Tax=Sulfitobacter pacificus TaxID=1499314 RepID=UPI00360E6008
MQKAVVNSWNEWDLRKHVIAGRAVTSLITMFVGRVSPVIPTRFISVPPDLILNNPLRPQPEDQRGMFEANGREIEYVAHPADKTAMS